MPVTLTYSLVGPKFSISADAVMPTITVTAALAGVTVDPRSPPVYTWNATLVFTGSVTPHGSGSFGFRATLLMGGALHMIALLVVLATGSAT